MEQLVAVAAPMMTTFHRAFDKIANQTEALEQLVGLGFKRILTSGRPGNLADHTAQLKQLVRQSGDRIIIVAGGGIRDHNLAYVFRETSASVLHMSCRFPEPDDSGIKHTDAVKVHNIMRLRNELL